LESRRTLRVLLGMVLAIVLFIGGALAQPANIVHTAAAFSSPQVKSSSEDVQDSKVIPGRLIIKFKDNVSEDEIDDLVSQSYGHQIEEIPQLKIKVIKVPDFMTDLLQSRLQGDSRVQYVEKDYLLVPQLIPSDPQVTSAWHLQVTNTFKAFNITKGDGVTIAILDTGVQNDHPDLVSKLVPGYNFYSNNNEWSSTSTCSHGTQVAGVAAAATNNEIGVAGVAWNSKILPLTVSGSNCLGSYSAMGQAIVYAADHGAKVANISFLIYDGAFISDAAKYMYDKGGWVVAAGGNTGVLENYTNNPYIISVAATTGSDALTYYSASGPYIDFAAPGDGIPTTFDQSQYGWMGGTSVAAPVVSGIVALMYSANPSASPEQIYDALKKGSIDLGDAGYDYRYGWGRVDSHASVQYARGISGDFVPPDTRITSAIDGSGNTITSGDTANPPGPTNSTSITFSFTGSDSNNPSAVVDFECEQDSGAYFSCTSPVTLSSLLVGYHTFGVRAVDPSNNVDATPSGFIWQVTTGSTSPSPDDSVPPVLTLPNDLVVDTIEPAGTVVAFVATAIDTVDGSVSTYCNPASGSKFPIGTTMVTCTATDSHGNSATGTFAITVTLKTTTDNTPPTLLITNPTPGSSVRGTVKISTLANDSSGIAKVEFYINNILKKTLSTSSSSNLFEYSWNTKSMKNGTYTIKVVAYDLKNNSANSNVTVTVANGNGKQ
jgi:subtilisin family serine protease